MENNGVVVFDGVCNLCVASVQFILRHEKKAAFRFAPVQSRTGKELLERFDVEANEVKTILLIEGGRAHFKSDAATRIAGELRWPWKALVVFRVVPQPIRDWVYDLIARNRYRWFGRKETCMVPNADIRERFWE